MAQSTVKKSDLQTAFVAEKLKMKPTPRSGATLRRKGDAQDGLSIVECKTYMDERDSFTVKREWLDKVERERREDRKRYAFLVQNFGGKPDEDNYVVIHIDDFAILYAAAKQAAEENYEESE